jgi:hypothetical protein
VVVEAHPQWIARAYAISPGRDHLGLGSVSSAQILSALSPGINVLTFHPRYYSFYTFLLDEYWRRGRPGNATDFRSFYRAREFIFSVGAHLCDRSEHVGTGRIVGSNKTASLAGQQRQAYNATYNYIKSPLGGYGLYYRSVMAEVGLIYPGGPGFLYPLDVPSEKGKEVAEAFRQTVSSTRYYRDYFDSDFLRQPNHHLAAQRRATFCLYLDLASQTQGFALTFVPARRRPAAFLPLR